MAVKLDLKDRKILYELDKNARQPASKIAKKIHLSVDGTNYRIKQLIKKQIIFKFMTFFDTAKLEFTTYKVFFRFQNTTLDKETEIIHYFTAHANTQLVTSAQGMFDLNINILARNAEELNTILSEINQRYGTFFAERVVNILVESHFFFRDYLLQQKPTELRKPMYFGSAPIPTPLDEPNRKIITLLAQDARMSSIAISQYAGLSSDAVIQRIRKLEKAGIIQNYVVFPNAEEIGYHWYYLLLRFRDTTPELEKRFFNFCRLHPNIWFYSKMIGMWDVVINPDVKDDNELKEILMLIKNDFSKILKEYNLLKITKAYKFNQYPVHSKEIEKTEQ